MTASHYRSAAGERAALAAYARAIAGWPVACEQQRVPTRYGETFVLAFGSAEAPPLVLLHGAASNSAVWARGAEAFAACFRVSCVDLIGEAGRSAANRPPWRGPAFAAWLGDVLDGLGLRRTRLLGVSQGGWVALKFAAAVPERVERLVAISPAGVVADRPSFVLRALAYRALGARGARRTLELVFSPQRLPPAALRAIADVGRQFKPRYGIVPRFSDAELRRLTMPVLLVGGERDALRDVPAMARRLSGLLPRLAVELVPGAGHALAGSAGRVLPFLAEADGVPPSPPPAAEGRLSPAPAPAPAPERGAGV